MVSIAFRPVIRVEEKARRMLHKKFENNVKEIDRMLEEINQIETERKIPKKIPYKSVGELKKSRINKRFKKAFEEDIEDLKEVIEKIKEGEESTK